MPGLFPKASKRRTVIRFHHEIVRGKKLARVYSPSVRAGINEKNLWDIGLSTLQSLETEQGMLASGKNELYGCIFGRDSLITALFFIHTFRKTGLPYFQTNAKKILLGLAALQGREVNIESGEEPGKCIHEFRPDRHEHLTKALPKPWYVYPDGAMRSYDTADATLLFLMATHEYYSATHEEDFINLMLPHVERALEWAFTYGDSNGDGFIDYRIHPERTYGGLFTHSWMDSEESLFHEDESRAEHPIAPVEVQAYLYAALRSWSGFFADRKDARAKRLAEAADRLKLLFNKQFVVETDDGVWFAYAIDGKGRRHVSPRSSMGHALFAVAKESGLIDGILDHRAVHTLVMRLMQDDLFEPGAGLRTLSRRSKKFEANSYHNGSIWPHDSALVAIGLDRHGYIAEARQMREALLGAYQHFGTPIELFVYERGRFDEYRSPSGQGACRNQAWSAAALCAILIDNGYLHGREAQDAKRESVR